MVCILSIGRVDVDKILFLEFSLVELVFKVKLVVFVSVFLLIIMILFCFNSVVIYYYKI